MGHLDMLGGDIGQVCVRLCVACVCGGGAVARRVCISVLYVCMCVWGGGAWARRVCISVLYVCVWGGGHRPGVCASLCCMCVGGHRPGVCTSLCCVCGGGGTGGLGIIM